MTRDQRYWRLLTLIEDYYGAGERRAGDPPAVQFSGPDRSAAGAGALRHGASSGTVPRPPRHAASASSDHIADESLDLVAREIAACRLCGLCRGRMRTVPGEGAPRPLVMVIGEGPGRDEDRSGRPFVGPAGEYLDRWLAAIGLRRTEDCFITNVVKCRPPANRDPRRDESEACLPFLQRQMRLLQPRVLLAVGRIAGQLLTGRQVSMAALRGPVYDYTLPGMDRPLPLVATYHPSGVLRNQSLRRAVWDDLRRLQRVLAGAAGDAAEGTRPAASPPAASPPAGPAH